MSMAHDIVGGSQTNKIPGTIAGVGCNRSVSLLCYLNIFSELHLFPWRSWHSRVTRLIINPFFFETINIIFMMSNISLPTSFGYVDNCCGLCVLITYVFPEDC